MEKNVSLATARLLKEVKWDAPNESNWRNSSRAPNGDEWGIWDSAGMSEYWTGGSDEEYPAPDIPELTEALGNYLEIIRNNARSWRASPSMSSEHWNVFMQEDIELVEALAKLWINCREQKLL